MTTDRRPAVPETGEGGKLLALLGPTLDALEAVRAETAREIKARALLRVPLGLAAGLVIGLWSGHDDGLHVVILTIMGGLAGYAWASHKLSEAYRRSYKDQVLPRLAARFGALSYRKPVGFDVATLRSRSMFDAFDAVVAEDEIYGERHGLRVSIVELCLTHGSGKYKRTVFDGLLAEVGLPRNLTGVTAVIPDGGFFREFQARLRAGGRERVRLDDPRFEERYNVYATDQVAARALLTPAFMGRLMALGARPHLAPPTALVDANRLWLAMPKTSGKDLFEPPHWNKPAANRAALIELSGDIEAVLQAADAVIDLDPFARRAMPSR